ncbi:hypothetical protein L1987_62018 [Smallanthus sonchifolius]|uniref:Uncharacterized protein n=1 Tax=Smallanthus sonchifolius TaxID=185202 RepID=A0ACB9C9B2_9ASTR|nr:hypothetical protein L1987_62018 [Smallanthus sonchifolius]
MEEGGGLRTRSFRNEDYTNRRVFLRSYPLHFDSDEDHQETQEHATATTKHSAKVSNGLGDTCEFGHGEENKKEKKRLKMKKKKEAIQKIIVTIVEWGDERVVVLKRFKHKVSFYVVACFPIVFKPPKALISAR